MTKYIKENSWKLISVVDISLDQFLTCKISGIKFSGVGTFANHLRCEEITLMEYWKKYYSDKLPICLESGEISDNKVKNIWNVWIPLCKKYIALQRKCNCILKTLHKLKRNGISSEYLTLDYWLTTRKMKLSDATSMLTWLLDQDNTYYKRLFDDYYETSSYSWGKLEKMEYIQSILNRSPWKLLNTGSIDGLLQRGVPLSDANRIHATWVENFPTTWKDPIIQRNNARKRYEKYTPVEIRTQSPRCVEYWMCRGYTLAESVEKLKNYQSNNTLEAISIRHNCSPDEAAAIQSEIYLCRKNTIDNLPPEIKASFHAKQDSSSMDYCLRKCNYNYESAIELFQKRQVDKCVPMGRASKESLRYFIPFYKKLRAIGITRHDIRIGVSGSSEYWLCDADSFYMYDFTIISKKIIVEYDGSYWHQNKAKDEIKEKFAISRGFRVYRINSLLTADEKFTILTSIINENF